MTASSDEALILRIATGDRMAMQVLFARHQVKVFRFVVRLISDEAAAEDVISEVFLDVWRHAGRFEARSSVSTWLLAIARNKAYSVLRRPRSEQLADDKAESIVDTVDDPEIIAQKRDKSGLIRECIQRLSVDHRDVIDLVYYHEKSIEEVAEIVGIPENTVKTRMFYARRKLSEMLQAAGVDRGWP